MSFIHYNTLTQEKVSRELKSPYTVDGKPGVLAEGVIELEIITVPYPQNLASDERAIVNEIIDVNAKTLTRDWTVIPYERPVPTAVARQQLFQWLFNDRGITRAQIRAMIEANPDETARETALIDFEEAQMIRRNHPLVAQLAAALGMTESEVDAGFIAASDL